MIKELQDKINNYLESSQKLQEELSNTYHQAEKTVIDNAAPSVGLYIKMQEYPRAVKIMEDINLELERLAFIYNKEETEKWQ